MLDYPDMKAILLQPMVSKVFCLSFALLLIWQLLSGVINLYSINARFSVQPRTIVIKRAESTEQNLKNALLLPIFGEYVPNNLKDLEIKRSNLNLKLVGILFSKEEAHSQVIIKALGEREQTYKIGDTVPGGAVIKRITVDGLLLLRKGVLESLSLPKNELIFAPPVKDNELREE